MALIRLELNSITSGGLDAKYHIWMKTIKTQYPDQIWTMIYGGSTIMIKTAILRQGQ